MRYWRVHFRDNGSIESVVQLTTVADDSWVIVKAANEAGARKAAYNIYCARKKTLAKQRHHAAGECGCGRKQDRKRPDGRLMLTCSVCGEREKVYNERYNKRVAAGTVGKGMAERDEGARVASNMERQRDRRGEIRLETLIQVRDAWVNARNVGLFTRWLEQQIEAETKGKGAAA